MNEIETFPCWAIDLSLRDKRNRCFNRSEMEENLTTLKTHKERERKYQNKRDYCVISLNENCLESIPLLPEGLRGLTEWRSKEETPLQPWVQRGASLKAAGPRAFCVLVETKDFDYNPRWGLSGVSRNVSPRSHQRISILVRTHRLYLRSPRLIISCMWNA